MDAQDVIDLKLQLNRIEEKLELLNQAEAKRRELSPYPESKKPERSSQSEQSTKPKKPKQINAAEETKDLVLVGPQLRDGQVRAHALARTPRSLVTIALYLAIFAANWVMVFATLPAVIDLPTGVYTETQRQVLLALRYIFVLLAVPLVHWVALDASVSAFVGFVAGHLAVHEVAFGYSPFSLRDERDVYIQVYKSAVLVALVTYVGVKVARGLH